MSLVGLRFFSALAQCAAMVLAGLMPRELGATRAAQILTALAVALAPISLLQGALFQYLSFDYLWWVLSTLRQHPLTLAAVYRLCNAKCNAERDQPNGFLVFHLTIWEQGSIR